MIAQLTAFDVTHAYTDVVRVERAPRGMRFFSRNSMHDCWWSFTPYPRPDYEGSAGLVVVHCTPVYA